MNFREKGSQDRGYFGELDFPESILRQRQQPCTDAFYNVNSDCAADPSIFSISGMYVFLLSYVLYCSLKIMFLVVYRDLHGNPLLDKMEEEHGGWLLLTLSYIHKVIFFCFINDL